MDIVRKRPSVVITAATTASLDRAQQARVIAPANVADMLGTLHEQAAMLIRELAAAEEPLAKRISMAKDVAKLLPLLDRAEKRCGKKVKDKDVDDMSDAELRQAHKLMRARAKKS